MTIFVLRWMNVCMFCVQNCGVGVWQKHWRTQIEVTKNMISISRDFDPVKLYPLGSQWLLQTLKKHKRKKVLAEQHCYDLLIIPKTLKHSNLSSKKNTKGKKCSESNIVMIYCKKVRTVWSRSTHHTLLSGN